MHNRRSVYRSWSVTFAAGCAKPPLNQPSCHSSADLFRRIDRTLSLETLSEPSEPRRSRSKQASNQAINQVSQSKESKEASIQARRPRGAPMRQGSSEQAKQAKQALAHLVFAYGITSLSFAPLIHRALNLPSGRQLRRCEMR